MASAQNSVQNSQTRTVHHNHVIIQYQQPPDPAIVNHVLEILVAVTRSYAQKNLVQIPYIQDYIDWIVPFLQTLYSARGLGMVQLLVMSIRFISQFLKSSKIRSLVP